MLVYAIDFGTSNSLLGAADDHRSLGFVPLDPDAPDPSILRSLLYFPDAKNLFFGQRAIQEFIGNDHAGRLIRSIKKQLPSRSFIGTYVDNRAFNLEDLIGLFLGELLRRRANTYFNQDVTRVVLGRPARFAADDGDDRFAEGRLERGARIAGFKEIEFVPEPVAAAFGYRESSEGSAGLSGGIVGQDSKIILAADFGGGTSDFTLYRLGNAPFKPSDVISLGGVPVAGDALDSALMRHRISSYFGTGVRYQVPFGSNVLTMPVYLMERICHPGEISLLRKQDTMEFFRNVEKWALGPEDREKIGRLMILLNDQIGFPLFEKIEETKKALSSNDSAVFDFSYPEIEIHEKVHRKEFNTYARSILETITQSLDETLRAGGVKPESVDRVLCTGGTARVTWIRDALAERFGREKLYDLDPFRGVAAGLMERARELT